MNKEYKEMEINSIADIKQITEASGNYFFQPATMRFFNSRIHSKVYEINKDAYLFITSERYKKEARKYTIRLFERTKEGVDISTVGEFQAYRTVREAKQDALTLIKSCAYAGCEA